MNSRQRIRSVLAHRIPDRIPIDLGSGNCTSISTIAYNCLRKQIGVKNGLARMYDFNMQLAYPEKEILDLFQVDIIDAGQAFLKTANYWKEWKLNDGSKCLIPAYLNVETDINGTVLLKDNDNLVLGVMPGSSLYVDQAYWAWQVLQTIPEFIDDKDLIKNNWSIPIPPFHLDVFDEDQFLVFVQTIKRLVIQTVNSDN